MAVYTIIVEVDEEDLRNAQEDIPEEELVMMSVETLIKRELMFTTGILVRTVFPNDADT